MLIAVVGGKLQGVEVVYLAQKAGWKTLVIDKNPTAPATLMCDFFLEFEFSRDHPIPLDCPDVDFILPAVEDRETLALVTIWARKKQIPLAFDPPSYALSSSKTASNALFKAMDLPVPKPWPGCGFPVVVKPDHASGSQGVEVFEDSGALFSAYPDGQLPDHRVIQQYLEGSFHSIEVVGLPGRYQALQVTDLAMDKVHDCKRVTAPTRLSAPQIKRFEKMAVDIAQRIGLAGIMDVEVVLNKDALNCIEIDARFPSQTPMAVYWSSGINMVEMLGLQMTLPIIPRVPGTGYRWVVVEHMQVSRTGLEISGEHIMSQDGPLTVQPGFFGANEAITSFAPGKDQWVATLVFAGDSQAETTAKREQCHDRILGYSRDRDRENHS